MKAITLDELIGNLQTYELRRNSQQQEETLMMKTWLTRKFKKFFKKAKESTRKKNFNKNFNKFKNTDENSSQGVSNVVNLITLSKTARC